MALPSVSNEYASVIKDQETKMNENTSLLQNIKKSIFHPANEKCTISPSTDIKHEHKGLLCHHHDSLHESTEEMGTTMNKLIRSLSSAAFEPDDEQVDDIQSIDIS
ncbi:unnamed protein product, partial [Rotaria sp. Silwood2]